MKVSVLKKTLFATKQTFNNIIFLFPKQLSDKANYWHFTVYVNVSVNKFISYNYFVTTTKKFLKLIL